jgi:hypothetical protein
MKRKRFKKKIFQQKIGKVFRAIFCIALVMALISTEGTNSFFSDSETTGISISAATLDMQLHSGQPNFSPETFANNLKPGDSLARDIYIGKTDSSLPFRYGAVVSKDDSCDMNLFNSLKLQVYYNFYTEKQEDSTDHQNRTMISLYNGNLSDFVLDQDNLQIPNENAHFDNKFYEENEHWLYFNISLPSDTAENVQMKNCNFNFNFKAWQTSNNNETIGFSDEELISNKISTGMWIAPETPTPLGWNVRSKSENSNETPTDIACGGITNGDFPTKGDGKVAFIWEEISYAGFDVSYEKQWLRPEKNPNIESNWEGHEMWETSFTDFRNFGSATGAEGLWHNRIRSVISTGDNDTMNLHSDWSAPCGIIYDRTAPKVTITNPNEQEPISGTVEIKGSVVDQNPHHYWLVIENANGTKIAGPETVNETESFTGKDLFTWDTTDVADGLYTIKLEARDQADNKIPNQSPVISDPDDENDSVDWIVVEVKNEEDITPPTNNTDEIQPGDVIINEVMWMGSEDKDNLRYDGTNDQWIELRNVSGRDLHFKDFYLTYQKNSDSEVKLAKITNNRVVKDGEYFLLAKYNKANSAMDIQRDNNETGASDDDMSEFEYEKFQIKLYTDDSKEVLIDTAGDGTQEPTKGDKDNFYSMERNNIPSDGANYDNWYTCLDSDSTNLYWDKDRDERGTPGHKNLSKNDPTSPDYDPNFQEHEKDTNINQANLNQTTESENNEVQENQIDPNTEISNPVLIKENSVVTTEESQIEPETKNDENETSSDDTEDSTKKESPIETEETLEEIGKEKEEAEAEKLVAEKKEAEEKKKAEEDQKKKEAVLAKQEEEELAKKEADDDSEE